MTFVQRDDMVEKVMPAALDPPFGNSVLPRAAFEGGAHGPDIQSTNRCRDFHPIFPVPVEDQKPRSRPKRERLPQLLDNPHTLRMLRDIEVQNTPTIVTDQEKTIQHTESDRWDREEVHRCDGFSMVTQKGEPTLGRVRIPRRSFHPTGDRTFREIEAKHEQLAMNARCSPGRILSYHSEDEIANILGNPLSTGESSNPRDGAPIEGESGSVPAHHRLRSHDDQGLPPSRPESSHKNPEEFVEEANVRTRVTPLQDPELLPKCEVFE